MEALQMVIFQGDHGGGGEVTADAAAVDSRALDVAHRGLRCVVSPTLEVMDGLTWSRDL